MNGYIEFNRNVPMPCSCGCMMPLERIDQRVVRMRDENDMYTYELRTYAIYQCQCCAMKKQLRIYVIDGKEVIKP